MTDRFSAEVRGFLDACSQEYDWLLQKGATVLRTASAETQLNWVELSAGFAGMHHPGRFYDGTIENVALTLGGNLDVRVDGQIKPQILVPQSSARASRRVLHVASTVHGIGGHTRTIVHWMRKDIASTHSLVLTSQGRAPIPPGVMSAVREAGGQLISLPEDSKITARALHLRKLALSSADLVVMHLTPNDVVPVAAFAVDGPPVALVNLADQCFWLGATVADHIIHLREIGSTSSQSLRATRGDVLLPIPMSEPHPRLDRNRARKELGLPVDQVALLTVGRSMKYAPTRHHNFFRTASGILERCPHAHLYLIGVRAEDHLLSTGFVQHDRMHFLGPIDDPTLWQQAADVYLEGVPFGSQTALLESVLPGIPCVPAYSPATPLLATQDFALDGVITTPTSEAEYIERACNLVSNTRSRADLGSELGRRVRHFHIGPAWNELLESVYRSMTERPHRALPIPSSTGLSREVDLAIADYHGTRFDLTKARSQLRDVVRKHLDAGAYWLRHRGEFSGAFRYLQIAASLGRLDRQIVGEAAKIGGQWVSRALHSSIRG